MLPVDSRSMSSSMSSHMDTSAALWYNHSSLIIDSSHHRLSTYGSMLPVLVVEAISNEEVPVQSLSIKICDSGWACLVSGTSLFVWKFSAGPSRTCPCYELELPPSDLSFRADLVTLLPPAGAVPAADSPVALLAVSPEGIVRFWSNILHESCFAEAFVQELQGQECSNLCPISSSGCLLATTTNSLLLISIQQNEPSFRTLRAPLGVLSGLSKKLSSFIFGGMAVAQSTETKSFIRIFKEKDETGRDFVVVYTMAGSTVQKWQIFSQESEVLRAEKDVDFVLKDRFMGSIAATSDPRQADVVILDAGLGKDNQLLLLVASLVPAAPAQLALAAFVSADDSFALISFDLISDPSSILSVHGEESLLNLKLLLCPERNTVYVYDESRIFFIRGNSVVDVIDFELNEDGILGAGVCDKVPLLFTCRDGLVMISSTVVDLPDDSLSESHRKLTAPPQAALLEKFRKAFYLFSRNEKETSASLISSAFDVLAKPEELAQVLMRFVEEIADSDTDGELMWEERIKRRKVPHSFSSQDILVTRQLEDKIANASIALEFVDSYPTLADLAIQSIPLVLVLNEMLEKLMLALSAKSSRMEFFFLTEPVLQAIADRRHSANKNFVHDEFFREASRVHELVPALVKFAESKLDPSLMNGQETLQLLVSTAEMLICIMSEVFSRRSRLPASVLKFSGRLENFSPWDSAPDGCRSNLIKLLAMLENPGCRLASNGDENKQNRESVFDKMARLTDIVLGSYSHQICFMKKGSAVHGSEVKVFNELRSKLLRPLVAGAQYEKATVLAEKYLDFDVLIEISEKTTNPAFLDKYSVMFASRDFTSHLFNWYMKRGRQEKVLKSPHMFSQMLEGHPDLQWLQQIEGNDYRAAAQTLKSLAMRETNRSKKITILSLCKLNELISPDIATSSDVDNMLEEISFRDMSEEA